LYALKAIFVVLVFFSDLQIVLLHSPRHYLVIFVLGIHHNDGGSIVLQLMHYLKVILVRNFFLSFSNAISKILNSCLEFPDLVFILSFSHFDGLIFFKVFVLLLTQPLSVLLIAY
jgi:hypothetical protein